MAFLVKYDYKPIENKKVSHWAFKTLHLYILDLGPLHPLPIDFGLDALSLI